MTRLATDELTGGTLYELPPEAGDTTQPHFEPDEQWLRSAAPDLQKTAIWRWFATRYEEIDAATPRDADGNYFLGVKDLPVTVDAVLIRRFGGLVPDATLTQLIRDAQAMAGNAWTTLQPDELSG